MADNLDMSLDDIIRKNREERDGGGSGSRGRGRGRNRGGGAGRGGGGGRPCSPGHETVPERRSSSRGNYRHSPYFLPTAPAMGYLSGQSAMPAVEPQFVPAGFNGGGEGRGREGTRLYLSNLDYGVTNQDIKMLFSDVAELKRYSIHYDRNGRSKGTAEVMYERLEDALEAMRKYNNHDLDGRPLRIELVGVETLPPPPPSLPPLLPTPAAIGNMGRPLPPLLPTPAAIGNMGRPDLPFNFMRGGEGFIGRNPARGGAFGREQGPGRDQGQEFGRGRNLSAEELDADLDRYRSGRHES